MSEIVFGSRKTSIPRQELNQLQEKFMFDTICDLDPEILQIANLELPDFYKDCSTFRDGLLTKGLYTSLADVSLDFSSVMRPENSKLLSYLFTNAPIPAGKEDLVRKLSVKLAYLDTVVHDYFHLAFQYASQIYFKSIVNNFASFESLRIVIMTIFLCIIIALHFIILHPIITQIQTEITHSREIVMLIPSDLIKHIPTLQEYIGENIARY